ncbi:hypothetical protein [Streptomyces sp. NPDC049915]|uniref:hypothetical protein n=1 Tax=Streptomyces sp. NPDC049915 TaxID=3155510 RepID=UPI00342A3100
MSRPIPQRNTRAEKAGKKILLFGCLPAFALIVLLIVIGSTLGDGGDGKSDSISADSPTASASAKVVEPTATPSEPDGPGISKRRLTEITVDLVWDKYTEEKREALCLGVEAYGAQWLADQLKSENLDHDYAGQLMQRKCESR